MVLSILQFPLISLRWPRLFAIITLVLWSLVTNTQSPTRVQAAELQPDAITVTTAVSAGSYHTCILRSNGTAACWGDRSDGQATPATGVFTQINSGDMHTCALRDTGTTVCWGDNGLGQASPPADTLLQVSAGTNHTCGLRSDNTLICWGDEDPLQTPPVGSYLQLSTGDFHNCAIRNDNALVCWGENEEGEASPPTGTFQQVSAGSYHTCAIRSDNTLACWGLDEFGQASPPAGTFIQVSAGADHTCGIQTNNVLVCWGDNDSGQRAAPTGTFIQVSAGDYHNCAIRSDGLLVCWGDNSEGQAPLLQIVPPTLPRGTLGVAYRQPLNADALWYEPVSPRFVLLAGPLPPGLTLNEATDIIGGTPTVAGSFPLEIRVIDANNLSSQRQYTLVINTPPVANPQSVSTGQNTPRSVTLTASDAEGDALTYSVVTQPAHGTVTGSAPNLTYTPGLDYSGPDSFTFKANDGRADSNPATVTITVNPNPPLNSAPVANHQVVYTLRNSAKTIYLSASDAESNPLTYRIISPPLHGALLGVGVVQTYTPTLDYSGEDSFTFVANDGQIDSAPATIQITVLAVNTQPVANAQNVNVERNLAKMITLSATDADSDALSYTLINQPAHGTLDGNPPNLVYTPALDYTGADSFTFAVSDQFSSSTPAIIQILVRANPLVNQPPVSNDQNVTTPRNSAKAITLTASDAEGDALVYTIVAHPLHGVLSGTPPGLLYTPTAGYTGTDSFTFQTNDGLADSNVATVAVQIVPHNTPPVANAQHVTVGQNRAKIIVLAGSDADNDPLRYGIVISPTHGTLSLPSGEPATNRVYTPNNGFSGTDTFSFIVNDGEVDSNVAQVQVTVTLDPLVNSVPVANDQYVTMAQGTHKTIILVASDADSDPLTYRVVTAPTHGAIEGSPPNLVYTPSADFSGADSFTFVANDNGGLVGHDSNLATVRIDVAPSEAQGAVTGLVFDDKNRNGQKEGNEPGIANIQVDLSPQAALNVSIRAEQKPERLVVTDIDGLYRFSQVPAGTYILTFTPPVGFEFAPVATQTVTVGASDEVTTLPFALRKIGTTIFLPRIHR